MIEEIWKPIKGYENLYEVSNLGRVRSLDRYIKGGHNNLALKKGKLLKTTPTNTNHLIVSLFKNGIGVKHYVHRLVAQAFIPNPDNKPDIDHIDTNPLNNHISNLRWVTESENMRNPLTLKKSSSSKKKKVFQYTTNGLFLKKWESVSPICKYYNLSPTTLRKYCRSNKQYCDCIWSYQPLSYTM